MDEITNTAIRSRRAHRTIALRHGTAIMQNNSNSIQPIEKKTIVLKTRLIEGIYTIAN
jgi:hypothetical protein